MEFAQFQDNEKNKSQGRQRDSEIEGIRKANEKKWVQVKHQKFIWQIRPYNSLLEIESIKDDHVGNQFYDIFVHLCHLDFFINANRWKLTDEWIYRTFYTFGTKNWIFIFLKEFVSDLHI